MFCKKCGNQIEEGAEYCKRCGTPVEKTAACRNGSLTFKNGIAMSALIVLVLQILQLIFYFVPIFRMETSNWSDTESFSVKKGLYALYEEAGYNADDLSVLTKAIVGLSIIAIAFTIILIFKIYKVSIIGHIFRFISWGLNMFFLISVFAVLKEYAQEINVAYGVDMEVSINFGGILFFVVNIALFIALLILVHRVTKAKLIKSNYGKEL